MRVEVHAEADAELTEAALYLESQRADYGDRFLEAVRAEYDELVKHPHMGHPSGDVREQRVRGFKYSVVYVVRADSLFVVAIARYRRQPGYYSSRLP